MAYTSPRRQESAAQTRQAILSAATTLFLERGYAATTIADIATAARVAPATVYTSVGGKPKVLEAIGRPPADDPELGRLIAHVEAADDPREAIHRAARATRYSAETNADVFAVVMLNAPSTPWWPGRRWRWKPASGRAPSGWSRTCASWVRCRV
ncbi:hypothetical protein GCM10029964_107370 [Kibdelosporangium lantanae]